MREQVNLELDEETARRLDKVRAAVGSTRAGFVRAVLIRRLDELERAQVARAAKAARKVAAP